MSDESNGRKDGELAGKVALITGAASGIGLAITRRFVKENALVAMVESKYGEVEPIQGRTSSNG